MKNTQWQPLISHPRRPNRCALSVYLNVDQAQADNLNVGVINHFRDMMASVRRAIRDSNELDRFEEAERHLADFLSAYAPHGRTLVMLFDQSDGFFWNEELDISMQNAARWDREFSLKPLAAATDDFERYGVVLVDRANARLFTVFLNQIRETAHERFNPATVRHLKAVSPDKRGTSGVVQRKADEQVRRNLRQIVGDVDALVKSERIDRLVLAGSPETTGQLRDLLPKRLAVRVIATLDLKSDASYSEVLAATAEVTRRYERDTEKHAVSELTTCAAKARNGVVGLGHTLTELNKSRVWQLIYSEDFHSPGFECEQCGALFSIEIPSCTYCRSNLTRVPDVVEKGVERALRNGARIEVVRSEAATALDDAGGIGAFLKTRTKAIEL
jgi:peptide subunit release factor 1 (eRF1)